MRAMVVVARPAVLLDTVWHCMALCRWLGAETQDLVYRFSLRT